MGGASNNGFCNGDNNQGTDNMYPFTHSEYAQFDNKKLISVSWDLVFANYLGITPASDFHFSEAYNSYTGVCGIYAGGGFSDGQLPPVPYIVAKQIPEQTDAEGKLNIKVRVNAGK